MKSKPRWMKSVIETAKKQAPLPLGRNRVSPSKAKVVAKA